MITDILLPYRSICIFAAIILLVLLSGCSNSEEKSTESSKVTEEIKLCDWVTDEQIKKIYRKPLVKSGEGKQCLWSKTAGGMSYFDISIHSKFQDLRKYFAPKIPSYVVLQKIDDLGDEGLMTVTEGSLGVVIIRKGELILQSAPTFLDIEPGSIEQQALWDIYRTVLDKL